MIPAAADPPSSHHHREIVRRTSSLLERVIQGRPSFRSILASAILLDSGDGDTSSAESIACYFMRTQQNSLDAHLLERQHQQRIGLRKMVDLFWFASSCSWKASLLCGSLYKSILTAKLSIARVQDILDAPFPHNQVGDLLLALANLQSLFSEDTFMEIEDCKNIFLKLDSEIKQYQHRLRIRALSRVSALNQRAHHGYTQALRAFTTCLGSCISGRSDSDEEPLIQDGVDWGPLPSGVSLGGEDDDGNDDFDVDVDSGAVNHCSGLQTKNQKLATAGLTGLTTLYKAHLCLHKLETCMHAINIMFDTLKSLVKGVLSQKLNQHYIESLRNEPLMFDGVAELITVCHTSLTKHLDDLREQVLISFCFINSARDLVYLM